MNPFKCHFTKILIIACLLPTSGLTQDRLTPIMSGVYKWAETAPTTNELTEIRTFMKGPAPHLEYLEIYAVTQLAGAAPRSEGSHTEFEACIIITEGTAKVTMERESVILGPAGVVLLMPHETLSLENTGPGNLTYYVMKYRSRNEMLLARGQEAGGSMMLNADSLRFRSHSRGGGRSYFDRPTAMCERFEMHVTRLDRMGPSHAAHSHEETEIILVLSGATAQTIDGEEYVGSPGDFYLMESQLEHSVRNTADIPCEYFAFKWM